MLRGVQGNGRYPALGRPSAFPVAPRQSRFFDEFCSGGGLARDMSTTPIALASVND